MHLDMNHAVANPLLHFKTFLIVTARMGKAVQPDKTNIRTKADDRSLGFAEYYERISNILP